MYCANIDWIVPSGWTIINGQGTLNINIQTNGSVAGSNLVKVKFVTQMGRSSFPSSGPIIYKPCGSISERTVEFNIEDCRPHIDYLANPTFHQSHSSNRTTFDGSIELGNDNYNYVSGGSVTIFPSFEFEAVSSSSLDLFIEECSCESPWHDPNLKGAVNISFPDAISFNMQGNNDVFSNNDNKEYNIIEEEIWIYPNPTQDEIHIKGLKMNATKIVRISISNAQGILISRRDLGFTSEGLITLNFNDLPSGIYIIQFYNNEKLYSKKIIKN